MLAQHLLNGSTKSCGCYLKEFRGTFNRKHGHTAGYRTTRLYRTWLGILSRTGYATNVAYAKKFKTYADSGITMCDEWREFTVFRDYILTTIGEPPRGKTLDRIDNGLGYVPCNVRWATPKQQARNRSNNVVITVDGVSRTASEWAEVNGLNHVLIWQRRHKLGWSDEKAVTTPRRKYTPY